MPPFGHQKTKTTLWVVLCFLRLPDGAEVKRSVLREAVSEVERSETESNGPPSGTQEGHGFRDPSLLHAGDGERA